MNEWIITQINDRNGDRASDQINDRINDQVNDGINKQISERINDRINQWINDRINKHQLLYYYIQATKRTKHIWPANYNFRAFRPHAKPGYGKRTFRSFSVAMH